MWAVHAFNICDGLGTGNHLRMITGLGFRVRICVEIAYIWSLTVKMRGIGNPKPQKHGPCDSMTSIVLTVAGPI